MPILFSAVAYQNNILTNFASCDGNFMEIVEEVVSRIPTKNEKMTYSHGHYLFHYIAEYGYFYFCITAKTCQRSRAFLFLNEIARRFKPGMMAFHQVLAEEMYRYSEDYSTITIRKGELDELNTIGVGSSETILGEKILYVNNPENLSFSTISYLGEMPQQILFSHEDNSKDLSINNTSLESKVQLVSNMDNNPKELSNNTMSGAANTANEKSGSKVNKKKYVLVFTVILVFMWLAISVFGSIAFVIVACILVFSLMHLPKIEKKS